MYILRSEMSALVTINNVWNSEGDKEGLRPFIMDLVCVKAFAILIYVLGYL